ncbi:gamma-glutamyl-gamma-aminobutyrate hydrolase family protein [Paraburkholderia sp. D1E]|uniref:gamma-glutamyl-gamma-aminobutyrate hydrolase family protein n=1 Tax=Paraburkholderia sp. D1E TaxID=3461398 RepID=UPI004045A46D
MPTNPLDQTSDHRPVVAIISDRVEIDGHQAHTVLHGYIRAASEIAGIQPLVLPCAREALHMPTLFALLDGLILTGSPSNVAAEHYGGAPLPANTCQDRERDGVVLGLLTQIIDAGIPLLGICRGFQELNVLHGGTLDPCVHVTPGRLDHREGDHSRPVASWYDDSHGLHIVEGTRLAAIAGDMQVRVNSLHHQGVARLGKGLRIEATAPDGLIEAFSVERAPQFTLGVQWHPEMRIDDSAFARAIFSEFGNACREHLAARGMTRPRGVRS